MGESLDSLGAGDSTPEGRGPWMFGFGGDRRKPAKANTATRLMPEEYRRMTRAPENEFGFPKRNLGWGKAKKKLPSKGQFSYAFRVGLF